MREMEKEGNKEMKIGQRGRERKTKTERERERNKSRALSTLQQVAWVTVVQCGAV